MPVFYACAQKWHECAFVYLDDVTKMKRFLVYLKCLLHALHMVNFYKNWQIHRVFLVCDRKKKDNKFLYIHKPNKCKKRKVSKLPKIMYLFFKALSDKTYQMFSMLSQKS